MFLPAILYVVALVGVPFVLAFLYTVGDVKVGARRLPLRRARELPSPCFTSPTFLRALRNSFVFTIASQVLVLIGAQHPRAGAEGRVPRAGGSSGS